MRPLRIVKICAAGIEKISLMTLSINRIFSIFSLVSIAIILVVLVIVTVYVIIGLNEVVEDCIIFGRFAELLILIYGIMFAPGVIISAGYVIYARSRFRGGPKSYMLEIISVIVAAQTVFTLVVLQDL